MNGWMDGWMDGREGGMDEWMNGWMGRWNSSMYILYALHVVIICLLHDC